MPVFDEIQHRGKERKHLQHSGFIFRYATGTHIELLLLIEPAYRSTMRALDIICIDLKLRPGLDLCIVRKDDAVILLIRLRLLGVIGYGDLAIEADSGPAGDQSLEKLTGTAVLNIVADVHSYRKPVTAIAEIYA